MNDILNAIKKDIANKNYYSVLFLTVMLPSICCALEAKSGKDNKIRYISWYNKYVSDLFLKGEDCYKLRCALLHQGKTIHKKSSFSGFRFTYPSEKITLHNNNFGGALNLDIVIFSEKILEAVDSWLENMQNNENYSRNIKNIIKTHEDGFSDFIKGIEIPVIY